MRCRIEMVQVREDKARVEDRGSEGGAEWAGPGSSSVNHVQMLQATACARNAGTRDYIRSDFPVAERSARNAEQK